MLLPAARAGVAVTGLDGSAAMLARCREKLAAEPPAVRERVTLHQGDARAFDLGRTFALVTAPFRILQHLVRVEEQLACLTCVARHLAPSGRLVFDVFNPNYQALTADRSAESEDTPETPEQALPDGRRMRRAVRVPRVRWTEQVSEVELIYYVRGAGGGAPERHVQAFDMRWYTPAELTHLLARAGLRVEAVYGGFDRSPLRDASPEQVVCAVRA